MVADKLASFPALLRIDRKTFLLQVRPIYLSSHSLVEWVTERLTFASAFSFFPDGSLPSG
jgi:hypothetical protein